MYHPKCIRCGQGKTIKWGDGRWRCTRCKKTFRLKRGDVRDRSAITAYIEDRSTYERLGERWDVHRSTAYRRVQRALDHRRTLLERTKRNLKRGDGIIVLDGKHVRIAGKKVTIFVAWDAGLGLPIHALIREGGEGDIGYWRLLVDLKRAGYVPKGFVSDGIISLAFLLLDHHPDLPHQRCVAHLFMAARSKLSGGGRKNERRDMLVGLIQKILWSETIELARQRINLIWQIDGLTRKEWFILLHVEERLEEVFVAVDPKWAHLKMPRTSNAIENVIGQIEARLKTRRGAKSMEALELLVNELLLRVKRQVTNR